MKNKNTIKDQYEAAYSKVHQALEELNQLIQSDSYQEAFNAEQNDPEGDQFLPGEIGVIIEEISDTYL